MKIKLIARDYGYTGLFEDVQGVEITETIVKILFKSTINLENVTMVKSGVISVNYEDQYGNWVPLYKKMV